MTERETHRLIAWSRELRRVHQRLRDALAVARSSLTTGASPDALAGDLFVYCRGFCSALGEHHRGEDRALFPAIEAAHPELAPTLRNLTQDHSMIDLLIDELQSAIETDASLAEVDRHLDGVAAIMESHFGYEERQLLSVLETLALDGDPHEVLGNI